MTLYEIKNMLTSAALNGEQEAINMLGLLEHLEPRTYRWDEVQLGDTVVVQTAESKNIVAREWCEHLEQQHQADSPLKQLPVIAIIRDGKLLP
jgi:hypothetical protein